jgi:hypothetical protein
VAQTIEGHRASRQQQGRAMTGVCVLAVRGVDVNNFHAPLDLGNF